MAEAVPLGPALQRHHDDVVGGADAAPIEHARIGIGPGAQHHVQRVDAPQRGIVALCALRPVLIEIERERDHLALAHQRGRRHDIFRPRVVERADLVVRTPLPPVLIGLGGLAQILSRELSAHEVSPESH
jgi:hypothetical protein